MQSLLEFHVYKVMSMIYYISGIGKMIFFSPNIEEIKTDNSQGKPTEGAKGKKKRRKTFLLR